MMDGRVVGIHMTTVIILRLLNLRQRVRQLLPVHHQHQQMVLQHQVIVHPHQHRLVVVQLQMFITQHQAIVTTHLTVRIIQLQPARLLEMHTIVIS